MSKKIKVLDCTFRDGGYYNEWDFDHVIVQRYLQAINRANVDVIELGLRTLPKNKFLGAFAYTTDAYINALNIDSSISVGVMIDASDILGSEISVGETMALLFQEKSKSRVDLVRIATHFSTIDQCREIAQILKRLGYQVGLNLMQAGTKSEMALTEFAKQIQSWKQVDVLYFADSLGNMDNNDVVRISSSLRLGWDGELGFHAHNNKGLAVSNSLCAFENGVTWIDSTILGMGRGAGNAQTENLLLDLTQKHHLDYQPDSLFDLVLSDFTPLQNQYHWGESLLYGLAAAYNIHPSYIQEMLADSRYRSREVLQAIEFMRSIDASRYDKNLLLSAHGNTVNKGSWDARDWCSDKEVLILGSGGSLQTYQKGIVQYIQIKNPIVISLNVEHDFPDEMIDVYVSSNESKMLNEFSLYNQLKKPLAISKTLLERVVDKSNNIANLWDYGLNIEQGIFAINHTECTLPYELSIGYALALANVGGAKSINVVGFDGYDRGDIRQTRMNELLDLYHQYALVSVSSLTPTTYHMNKGSIYAGVDLC